MTTVLRLDANAVSLLFPEDSEQRLELTNGVAAEVSKRFRSKALEDGFRGELNNISASIRNITKEYLDKELINQSDSWSRSTSIALTKDFKDSIKKQVDLEIKTLINEVINTFVNEDLDHYIKRCITAHIKEAVPKIICKCIDEVIEDQVSKRLEQVTQMISNKLKG